MSNHGKDSILNFLAKHAPKAPLGECLELAQDFQDLKDASMRHRTCLALLAEPLEFRDHGDWKELARKFKDDKAILWALGEVGHCHAWCVCGMGTGMDGVKKRVLLDIHQGRKNIDDAKYYLEEFKQETEE